MARRRKSLRSRRSFPWSPAYRTTQDVAYREALPVAADATSAIHCRAPRPRPCARARLHGSVLRRAAMAQTDGHPLPDVPRNDPLDDATVIVAGRGRAYPALSVAIGERAGAIGTLSIETAARYLKSRDTDGLVLGDGFGPRNVEALPHRGQRGHAAIAICRSACSAKCHAARRRISEYRYGRGSGAPCGAHSALCAAACLRGAAAPHPAILRPERHHRSGDRPAAHRRVHPRSRTRHRATPGSAAPACRSRALFSMPTWAPRAEMDAARLVSRLVRNVDFGCRDDDGSVLVAFTETDLRHAHVVARRIASVLKHTMLTPGPEAPADGADGDAGHAQSPPTASPPCSPASPPRRLRRSDRRHRLRAKQHEARHAAIPISLPIDVVSDVVCPWCFIGKKRIEKAIALKPGIPVTLRFHPYFLNDWIPREGISREDYLIKKFGSVERYAQIAERVKGGRRRRRPRLCARQDQPPAQHDRLPSPDPVGGQDPAMPRA